MGFNSTIKSFFENNKEVNDVKICCWIKTKRASKNICFLMVNDGSLLKNLQCVIDLNNTNIDNLELINTGASVEIIGDLLKSKGDMQFLELKVKNIKLINSAEDYPIQPKKHSLEFLREISDLRFRTNTFYSVFKIRSILSFAIHKFFNENGFIYINTPILTSNDAEGAGEMFTVTSLDLNKKEDINFENDFFGRKVNLTVSGQLEAESAIFGLGRVYTFGPTFRAENSNTTRHLAEFWMVEPEMAFCNLSDDIEVAVKFLKYTIKYILDQCKPELEFLDNRCKNECNYSLLDKLHNVVEQDFKILTYSEAIEILLKTDKNINGEFKYKITEWGVDLQSEHEKYLTDEYFKKPVILTNYPEKIKAFYMRLNDDNKTVSAMDILFPGIGEIIGGSQREERLDYLNNAIKKRNIDPSYLEWYIKTRQFGSVVHSGFGLGLDRLVQFVTGMENIRDTIPFPRYPKHCEF